MKNWVWLPLAVGISFSVYFAIKWGLKPKPIAQINPTEFRQPGELGAVLYRRLRHVLKQEKSLVLGSSPWIHDYDRVWNGFLAAAREDALPISSVYQDPNLKPIKKFQGVDYRNLPWPAQREGGQELAQVVRDLKVGRLVVLHTTFNHASRRVESSLSRDLESQFKRPWMTLTMLNFAVNAEEMDHLVPSCPDQINRSEDYLACSAARISRKYLRRKMASDRLWGAVEQHGLKEYFLFLHEPAL